MAQQGSGLESPSHSLMVRSLRWQGVGAGGPLKVTLAVGGKPTTSVNHSVAAGQQVFLKRMSLS